MATREDMDKEDMEEDGDLIMDKYRYLVELFKAKEGYKGKGDMGVDTCLLGRRDGFSQK